MDIDQEMHQAYIASMRVVASALPDAATAERGEWFLYDANVDNADFNLAVVARDPANAAHEIEGAAGWFRERGVGWRWKLRPGRDEVVISALGSRAGEAPRREPYMWRSVDGLPPAAAEGLVIERVSDERGLRAYDSFDAERGRPPEWSVARAVTSVPSCSLWLGWVDGRVVARAMAVASRPVGTIANVVVGERFRRRGFGAAITAAAAGACAEGGSRGVCLGASRMGYPLYLRMGFEHRYDLATYTTSSDT